ncbi:MAG TPA: hypothetical protein VOA41_12115 [Candidatus Dormibacteraeota bacterium]|nr:hypothetical protein [Candidatus Dormibacteraeota bacterium]
MTGATVTHLVAGLLCLGLVLFLLWLVRAPQTLHGHDPRGAIWGLEIAAGVLLPFALLVLAGAYGMARGKRWGWWLALLTDLAVVLALAYGMVDDGWRNVDVGLAIVTTVSCAPLILLLLPGVREFYRGKAAGRGMGAYQLPGPGCDYK